MAVRRTITYAMECGVLVCDLLGWRRDIEGLRDVARTVQYMLSGRAVQCCAGP